MVKAYEANMLFPGFRFQQCLWICLTGFRFRHFVTQMARGLGDMSRMSMTQSAWDTLARLGLPLETEWRFDRKEIACRPVLLYASHPSYVEPLLCLAALKEVDPVIVATGWLKNISEPVSRNIIGICDSKEATAEYVRKFGGLRGIFETVWAHVLTYRVVEHLQGDMSSRQCAASRRAALKEILATLASGRPLFMYPSGGDAQKFWVGERNRHFENFLRMIIGSRSRYPELARLCFVPVVRYGSLRALFRSTLWEPWHPLALFSRILPARPFKFVMRERVTLGDLIEKNMDAAGMAAFLMEKLRP
jgi:hypothetical protein